MAKSTTAKSADTGSTFLVIKPFRDKGSFTQEHKIGDDVSHFDKKRIQHLISIGHVEEVNSSAASEGNASTGKNDPE